MTHKPHILFVDDEKNILLGLKRGMRSNRHAWNMSFASSGGEALEIFKEHHVDIIVSDMRMPIMDGAQLLERVRKISPDTARVVLSGYAKDEVILKVIGPAHQYLAKPCDFDDLEETIKRILRLRNCIGETLVRKLITGKKNLPSLPEIYQDLLAELENPMSTNRSIAHILEKDIGLKAQVFKVCNSAFFGLPQKVNNLETAVSMIGLGTLRSMTLLNGFFTTLKNQVSDCLVLERLSNNSLEMALMAARLAKKLGLSKPEIDLAISAGSLCHIGTLIVSATWPHEFEEAVKQCEQNPDQTIDCFEREQIGADHGVIGAYLLGLWGFPLNLCEAVAYHHRPHLADGGKHRVLCTLHMAQHFSKMVGRAIFDEVSLMRGIDVNFLKEQDIQITTEFLESLNLKENA
ncbi:signal transduction protein [Terasakiella brassicae]|uniref:Signal transduction protein n=1 Tax=Terasakiella brassicae TaxID=1634917 RepID=A0A917BTK5_9PROT|nr:response regulator [Terasakiella brassicae]GGF55410.1 signal transduction protein [Terasakiella brassicae]